MSSTMTAPRDASPSPALLYLSRKFPDVPALQVISTPNVDRRAAENIRVVSADLFLSALVV